MKEFVKIYDLAQLHEVVDALYAEHKNCAVYTFTGSLGAGKTTMVQALLQRFGVQEQITSPTFTYVNVYTNGSGQKLYHFDLYRIESMQEFFEQGFNEYLYQNNSWAFIEWPEIIMPLLTHNVCNVTIDFEGAARKIICQLP